MLAKYPGLWAWTIAYMLHYMAWTKRISNKLKLLWQALMWLDMLHENENLNTFIVLSGVFALTSPDFNYIQVLGELTMRSIEQDEDGIIRNLFKSNGKSFEQVYYEVYKIIQERNRGNVEIHS